MKEQERRMLQDVKAVYKWMTDSAHFLPEEKKQTLFDYVYSLKKEVGDNYEVYMGLHMKNGECLTVSNKCWLSLLNQEYQGATIEFEEDNPILYFTYYDKQGLYHHASIPVSAILWVDSYSEDVKWIEQYRNTSSEEIERFEQRIPIWWSMTKSRRKK